MIIIIRYIVNLEDIKNTLDNIFENTDGKLITGKEYSKGYMLDINNNSKIFNIAENNILEKKIIILDIIMGTTTNTFEFAPDSNIDIYLENSNTGSKKYIFENVYLSELYKVQKLHSPLVLRYDYNICIKLNNANKYTNAFIDITYTIPKEE